MDATQSRHGFDIIGTSNHKVRIELYRFSIVLQRGFVVIFQRQILSQFILRLRTIRIDQQPSAGDLQRLFDILFALVNLYQPFPGSAMPRINS